MRFKLLVSIIICIFCQYRGFAQDIHFTTVEPPKENGWLVVAAMSQDPQGYLWLATEEGVYKYDGHQYTLYRHELNNPNSLAFNWAESIFADQDGIIWIGTFGAGLDRLDPSTNSFTHYRHQPGNSNSLVNEKVSAIIRGRDGAMWLGTFGGLEKFDPKTGIFKHFSHDDKIPSSLSDNTVRAVYEDRQGTIWAGTGSVFGSDDPGGMGGLNKLDKSTGKFTRYLHDPKDPHSLIDNRVRAILEDSRGTFWIGTAGDGLHTMDRKKGIFQRYLYDPAHPEKLSRPPLQTTLNYADDHITFINEDKSGKIWIGTFEGGINVYDPDTRKTTWYGNNSKSKEKLIQNDFWCSYLSRDGILWVAPWQSTLLYKVSPYQNKLPYTYLGQSAYSFAEAPDNAVWITTYNGLIYQDKNNKQQTYYRKNALPETASMHFDITDNENDFWMPNGTKGFLRFNLKRRVFISYRRQAGKLNSLTCDTVLGSPQKTASGKLWVMTFKGLDQMDIKTGTFTHFLSDPKDPGSISSLLISTICVDRNNTLWVAGVNAINRLDIKTMHFKKYYSNNLNYCILNDSNGNLWVGTDNGLYKYNSRSDSFSAFGTDRADVFGLLEDRQKKLWLNRNEGLAKFDPKTKEMTVYGENQGINAKALTSGYVMRDGKMLLGDTGGYFAFYPDKLLHSTPAPSVDITTFSLADVPVAPSAGGILTEPLSEIKNIRLNHSQTTFSFGFNCIDFVNDATRIMNTYMLEGYESKWRKGSSDQTASYYNVPPGKYIFKVKSVNTNGLFTQKSIAVIISPPWWQTWWASIIFILLFVSGVWGLIYYRSLSLLRDKRILEHKVHVRTEEVMQQKEEIEAQRDNLEKAFGELKTTQSQLIQSEKMASLGELTAGIAHEIQNPLNFVNNFSEVSIELLDEMETQLNAGDTTEAIAIAGDIKQNLEKINHHGKRADSIVKGMLQHSRNTSGQKEPMDINALADEYLRLSYHGLRAKDKSFNAATETHFDENAGKININPQDIGRVILNLLTNAFYSVNEKKKLQPDGYNPTVIVSTKKINSPQASYIEIKVRDNGVGIPQKILDKIYQPFFTTKPTGQGTGLGLSMSYDIVKAHGGELLADTKEGVFTEFTVKLPLN